jgi:hypothetical protein
METTNVKKMNPHGDGVLIVGVLLIATVLAVSATLPPFVPRIPLALCDLILRCKDRGFKMLMSDPSTLKRLAFDVAIQIATVAEPWAILAHVGHSTSGT